MTEPISGRAVGEEVKRTGWVKIFPKRVKRGIAGRDEFQKLLTKFLQNNGVSILVDGKQTSATRALWKLYKELKAFEIAMTASCCQISIRGIGAFYVKSLKSGKRIFRYRPSALLTDVFALNPELIKLTRETSVPKIERSLRAIDSKRSPISDSIEIDNQL